MATIYRRDPERGWRMWSLSEIYTGEVVQTSKALYVPNVGDLVFDNTDTFYRVDAIDAVTQIPTLAIVNPWAKTIAAPNPDNIHEGLKMYQPHIATRIFIDKLTKPATVSIDPLYRVLGDEHTRMKFFKGTDTSDNGTVISQVVNSNGAVTSETVDLVPIYPGVNTQKRPTRFHTHYDLKDGDLVTAVVYNATGRASGEHTFVVRNAGMIASPTANNVYVEDIELISGLISDHDPLLIQNQLNVPFTTSMMTCRVHYSDGSYQDMAVDGSRVRLNGLSKFNTGLLGPTTHVVLSYFPTSQEQSINLSGYPTPSINKTYKLANVPANESYAFKLYIIPVWEDTLYRLKVRLTDLEYSLNLDVTDHVTIKQANGWDFNGMGFGLTQTLHLTLRLDDVLPGAYTGHVHVQQLLLTLTPPYNRNTDNWVIDYIGDGYTTFGVDVYAIASSLDHKPFTIGVGQQTQYDWLSRLYNALDPIFDSTVLDEPPVPTHFRLENGGEDGSWAIGTFTVDQWNNTFQLGLEREWDRRWPLNIVWLVNENGMMKTVGITPLSIENDV